jgi:periplasmic copper chaperone A
VKTSMCSKVPVFIALLGMCTMPCLAFAADNPNVVAKDAWVRMVAPSRTDTAAYMVIENKSASARSVVSVSSPDVTKIEMHEMKMTSPAKAEEGKAAGGSMMTMMPVTRIDIPAKGRATLAPNGLHLMLFGLKSKLTEGGKMSITLKLDDGSTVPVTASVRSPQ